MFTLTVYLTGLVVTTGMKLVPAQMAFFLMAFDLIAHLRLQAQRGRRTKPALVFGKWIECRTAAFCALAAGTEQSAPAHLQPNLIG